VRIALCGVFIAIGFIFGPAAMVSALLIVNLVGWIVMLTVMAGEKKRRLRRVGRCECGYDMRATPNRCPECGRPIPRAPATVVHADIVALAGARL
jgi:hypothetical protein